MNQKRKGKRRSISKRNFIPGNNEVQDREAADNSQLPQSDTEENQREAATDCPNAMLNHIKKYFAPEGIILLNDLEFKGIFSQKASLEIGDPTREDLTKSLASKLISIDQGFNEIKDLLCYLPLNVDAFLISLGIPSTGIKETSLVQEAVQLVYENVAPQAFFSSIIETELKMNEAIISYLEAMVIITKNLSSAVNYIDPAKVEQFKGKYNSTSQDLQKRLVENIKKLDGNFKEKGKKVLIKYGLYDNFKSLFDV